MVRALTPLMSPALVSSFSCPEGWPEACRALDKAVRITRTATPRHLQRGSLSRSAKAYTSTSQSGRHTPSSLRFLSSTHAKPAWSAAASIALQTQSEPRRSRGSTCVGNQAGSGLGPLALRRLPSAPEHASGGPKLRPASANQPLVPHWPAIQALLSTSCSTVSSRRASGLLGSSNAAAVVKRARRLAAVQGKSQMGE